MLLKITESCSMGCSHCMNDCKPDDKHMDRETFDQALKFIKDHSTAFHGVVFSGGEPFEHPNFKEYLHDLVTAIYPVTQVIVATNGLWICQHMDEFKELHAMYGYKKCGKLVLWQITTDYRYYPISLDKDYPYQVMKLEKMRSVFVERKIQQIYPQGRAETNNLDWKSSGPKCFNVRSIAKSVGTFNDVLKMMTGCNKSCCPAIEYNGDLKLGESQLCPAASNIWKTDKEIMEDIKSFKCMNCKKPLSQLPEAALNILK